MRGCHIKFIVYIMIFILISIYLQETLIEVDATNINSETRTKAKLPIHEWNRLDINGNWTHKDRGLASHPSINNMIHSISLDVGEELNFTFGLLADLEVNVYLTAPLGDLDMYIFDENNELLQTSTNEQGNDEFFTTFIPTKDQNYIINVVHDARESSYTHTTGTLFINQFMNTGKKRIFFEGKDPKTDLEQNYTRYYIRVGQEFESVRVIAPDTLDFYNIIVYGINKNASGFFYDSYKDNGLQSSFLYDPFQGMNQYSHNSNNNESPWSLGLNHDRIKCRYVYFEYSNSSFGYEYVRDDAQYCGDDMYVEATVTRQAPNTYSNIVPEAVFPAGAVIEIIAEHGEGWATIEINNKLQVSINEPLENSTLYEDTTVIKLTIFNSDPEDIYISAYLKPYNDVNESWKLIGTRVNIQNIFWDMGNIKNDQYFLKILIDDTIEKIVIKIPIFIFHDYDRDGVTNENDAFPYDPAASMDSDGDGYPDQWNSGLTQVDSTTGLKLDAYPKDPFNWNDTDGDGINDNDDLFPFNPDEWNDTDGDGVGDNGDAFPNNASESIDIDGDNYGDNIDEFPNDNSEWIDSDGDGFGNNSDKFPENATEWEDVDGDNIGDNMDFDLDNDDLDDLWELTYFGNLSLNGSSDPDLDGYSNIQELSLESSPVNASDPGHKKTDGDAGFDFGTPIIIIIIITISVIIVFLKKKGFFERFRKK